MGKRMTGSCLDFANPLANYPATFVNALDANKAVFFITDENKQIIGRVLVGIDEKNQIHRAQFFFKDGIAEIEDGRIEEIFDVYLTNLA